MSTPLPDETWLRAAIGPKADFYLPHFERIAASRWAPTWNSAAVFWSAGWFFYRGMTGWAIVDGLALGAGFGLLSPKTGDLGPAAGIAILVGLFFVLPVFANGLYYRHLAKAFAARRDAAAIPPRGAMMFGAVLVGVAFPWLGLTLGSLYMVAGVRNEYLMRGRVSELVRVADRCKAMVARYYGANHRMPASASEASCVEGKAPHVAFTSVDRGVIRLRAGKPLSDQLAANESGIDFQYTPRCEGGRCEGARIVSWDCKSGTSIKTEFLPRSCR